MVRVDGEAPAPRLIGYDPSTYPHVHPEDDFTAGGGPAGDVSAPEWVNHRADLAGYEYDHGSSLDHASTKEYNLTNQRQVHPVQVPGTPSCLWHFIMAIEKTYERQTAQMAT